MDVVFGPEKVPVLVGPRAHQGKAKGKGKKRHRQEHGNGGDSSKTKKLSRQVGFIVPQLLCVWLVFLFCFCFVCVFLSVVSPLLVQSLPFLCMHTHLHAKCTTPPPLIPGSYRGHCHGSCGMYAIYFIENEQLRFV